MKRKQAPIRMGDSYFAQWVGRVIHTPAQYLISSTSKQPVTLDQEEFKSAQLGFSKLLSWSITVAKRTFRPESPGSVIDFAVTNRGVDLSELIWKRKARPGYADCKCLVCIQGVEPDAGPPGRIANVRSQIQFKKV